MTDFPFAIVGFDLDGTLCDTLGDIAASVNFVLNTDRRRSLGADRIKALVGNGLDNTLRGALKATGGYDEAMFPRLYAMLRAHYEANIATTTRPYPGAVEAIDALRDRGVKIGMVTNKAQGMADKLLHDLGIRDRFDSLIGGDTLGVAKPSGTPIAQMVARCGGGASAYVGDTFIDSEAARKAGLPFVAVSFGFHIGAIEDLRAGAVIDRFDDLIPTLERLAAQAT